MKALSSVSKLLNSQYPTEDQRSLNIIYFPVKEYKYLGFFFFFYHKAHFFTIRNHEKCPFHLQFDFTFTSTVSGDD